ncbi:MAG: outer membrane channel protein [candidate division BRC1 bacterium ADurb.BinA364]|nr:MAG: outer membrane channel protein [candidate division BRC1 bacterium ADurb.BinA364]
MRGAGFEIALETIRRENLSRMSSEISDYMQRRDVALNVISQFFGIAVTLSNIDVSQTALEVKRKFIRDAETLYEAGTAIPNEIAKAEVQYLNEELRLVNQKQNLENQIESLLEVLGLPLDTPISFAFDLEKLVDSRVAAIPDRESAVQEALAKRPELLITDINVRSSEIALNSARNATLPNLDLQASYADTETQPHFGDLNMDEHRVWTAGVSLAVPLPNIRLKEAAKRAELSLETAKTNRIIRQRQIVQEVDRQLRQLSASEQSIELLRRTVEQAEFNFKQESELFVYGERTSNQVRDAQDDYFAAKEEFNRQIINYQSAIAQIYKALGRSLF